MARGMRGSSGTASTSVCEHLPFLVANSPCLNLKLSYYDQYQTLVNMQSLAEADKSFVKTLCLFKAFPNVGCIRISVQTSGRKELHRSLILCTLLKSQSASSRLILVAQSPHLSDSAVLGRDGVTFGALLPRRDGGVVGGSQEPRA